MNRGAIGYIVTPNDETAVPFVAKCIVEGSPDGTRILVDDSSGLHWFPRRGLGTVESETDDALVLVYADDASSQFSETGLTLEPVTVERWNKLADRRPEMTRVGDFDDLTARMRW